MQRTFEVDKDEYPFESHWMPYKDTHLHYVDEGEGVPVLMLHGNPTWSFLYRNVIKSLSGQCRTIAPDYPGFGFSGHPSDYGYTPQEQTEAVLALVDHLQLEHLVLVIQDWGGPIGMSIATQRPEQVAGIVICNTWCWPSSLMLKTMSCVLSRPSFQAKVLEQDHFVEKYVRGAIEMAGKKPQAVMDAYLGPFLKPGTRTGLVVFPADINRSKDWLASLEGQFDKLREKPVELVFGMKDIALGRTKVIKRWLSHFPRADVDKIKEANHFVQEDSPERMVAAIERILAKAYIIPAQS